MDQNIIPVEAVGKAGTERIPNCHLYLQQRLCIHIHRGRILLMYSMEKDECTILDFPEVKQDHDGAGGVHALGLWDGRIFTTREDCRKRKVTVWELVDQSKQQWVKYVVISGADYNMLMKRDFANYGPSIYEGLSIVPCFCDGYLLIYNWHYSNCQSYALGMLNLATYEWEKVDLPPRTLKIKPQTQGRSKMEERSDFEECDDEDHEDFEEDSSEVYVISDSSEEEEDEDYEGSESGDSDSGCAPMAIRIRKKPSRSKNRHPEIDKPLITSGGISAEADEPPFTMGSIVIQPRVVEAANTFTTGVKPPLGAKAANLKSATGKFVKRTTEYEFVCAMCFFGSDVSGDYEAHKKTKVHRVVEELQVKDKKPKNPLIMLNEYVANNQLKVNYEITNKLVNFTTSCEVIATVGGGSGATAGPLTRGLVCTITLNEPNKWQLLRFWRVLWKMFWSPSFWTWRELVLVLWLASARVIKEEIQGAVVSVLLGLEGILVAVVSVLVKV